MTATAEAPDDDAAAQVESLLSDPSSRGVRSWTGPAELLTAGAAAAGWFHTDLDTTGQADPAAVRAACADRLALARGAAAGWPQLGSALARLPGPALLAWSGSADLRTADPGAFDAACETLGCSALLVLR